MKKQYRLILLLLIIFTSSISGYAQMILSLTNAPSAGDSIELLERNYTGNLGDTGAYCNWNFQTITGGINKGLKFKLPSQASTPNPFGNSVNMCTDIENNITFYNVITTGIYTNNISFKFSVPSLPVIYAFTNYTRPLKSIAFPSAFGSVFQDSANFTIKLPSQDPAGDSLRSTYKQKIYSEIDGAGMLTLPNNQTVMALRQKFIITTISLEIQLHILGGNWVNYTGIVPDIAPSTFYTFWGQNVKYPLYHFAPADNGSGYKVMYQPNVTITGLSASVNDNGIAKAMPNPSINGNSNIVVPKDWTNVTYTLYSSKADVVANNGANQDGIISLYLPTNGMYLLRLTYTKEGQTLGQTIKLIR